MAYKKRNDSYGKGGEIMTKESFFNYCFDVHGTEPDYPFEKDLETAVFRHKKNRKWFAICMRVPEKKFGILGDRVVDVVNLKIAPEIRDSFSPADGVYPAYHMSKTKWISIILERAEDSTVCFLTDVSFKLTK